MPTPKVHYVLGKNVGSNVNKEFAQQALDIMNKYVANNCLHDKFMLRYVNDIHNVEGKQVANKEEAYVAYLANAPYALDLRWYRPKLPSSVIGYTFNWLDGLDEDECYNQPTPQCPTETKIYSNTSIISGYTAGDYAAHLTHESSHQARARGFTHWNQFDGTFPYEIGYAMDDCVNAPTGKTLRNEQRAPSAFRRTMEAHKRHEQSLLFH